MTTAEEKTVTRGGKKGVSLSSLQNKSSFCFAACLCVFFFFFFVSVPIFPSLLRHFRMPFPAFLLFSSDSILNFLWDSDYSDFFFVAIAHPIRLSSISIDRRRNESPPNFTDENEFDSVFLFNRRIVLGLISF